MNQQHVQGRIFDVERFSTKDGPGIRTVAFFKGCNLHCAWCHNPEGLAHQTELGFDLSKCVHCHACASVCPTQAHTLLPGVHRFDRSLCKRCFACSRVCFSGALRQIGREVTAEALADKLAEDAPYFSASGGGVTLSGGEVLCQPEFAAQTLSLLKMRGIHTAVETNLCAPWEACDAVFKQVDLVMADVKTLCAQTMRQYIGGNLTLLLQNLERLFSLELPLIIRTPVIPCVNDNEIAQIAHLLQSAAHLQYYELLSYHPLGQSKARMLDKPDAVFDSPSRVQMESLAAAARKCRIPVSINGTPT